LFIVLLLKICPTAVWIVLLKDLSFWIFKLFLVTLDSFLYSLLTFTWSLSLKAAFDFSTSSISFFSYWVSPVLEVALASFFTDSFYNFSFLNNFYLSFSDFLLRSWCWASAATAEFLSCSNFLSLSPSDFLSSSSCFCFSD
jgi:hypothetical protein